MPLNRAQPIAVIGGGAAGVTAAVALAVYGYTVRVVADGPGATAFHSGAVDVAGDPDRLPGRAHKANRNVRTNLLRQLLTVPEHPWRRLAMDGGQIREERLMERIDEALNFFRSQLAFVGYGLEGQALMRQKGYLTAIGTVKECSLLHSPHARVAVDDLAGGKLLLIGIERMADSDIGAAGRLLVDLCGERLPKDVDVSTAAIDMGVSPGSHNVPGWQIAQALETGEGAQRLLKEVDRVAAGKSHSHLFFPPVMGLQSAEYHLVKISEMLDRPAVEMLGVTSSVPGWRFHEAMKKLLEFHEVEVISQPVIGFEGGGGRLHALKTPQQVVEAGAVVMASGRFLSGGLVRDAEIREPLFDLPVFWRDRPVRRHTNHELSDPNPLNRQPLHEVGLRVDEAFRPLDETGRVPWSNLHACGSLLAGSDYVADHAGAGLAVATGYRVAQILSKE